MYSMYIYIYIYTHVYTYIYIYVYTHMSGDLAINVLFCLHQDNACGDACISMYPDSSHLSQ